MPKKVKFIDPDKDLCDTCSNTATCPIYPTMKLTTYCVEYKKRSTKK
jgi:hypothetical protein